MSKETSLERAVLRTIDRKTVGKMKPGTRTGYVQFYESFSIRIIQSLETMLSIEMKIAHSR